MRVGPEMQVNVEQKRVSESDTDNGDGVGKAQQRGPGVEAEIEETVERDDEVAGVPTAHREREQRRVGARCWSACCGA